MSLNANSLERLIPDQMQSGDTTGVDTLNLHLERYEFASSLLRPGRVLDMACGVGYGTRLLADRTAEPCQFVGVDLSDEVIGYARERYGGDNIRFLQQDAMTFRDEELFDTVISLETIEHVPEPDRLVGHLTELLRPGGVLIGSVPTTPSVDVNPYHLTDFTERSFRRMFLERGFEEIRSLRQVQPYQILRIMKRQEARTRDLRSNLPGYYLTHPRHLATRLWTTLRHGFNNHFLTTAWRKT